MNARLLLRHLVLMVFSAAILLAATGSANATTILYSTRFENPPFTLGPLAGQDGWQQFGPASVNVENYWYSSPYQAVSVDGSVGSQSGPYRDSPSNAPFIELVASIYLTSSSIQGSWQFAATGVGGPFIAGFDTDPNTNQLYLITAGFPVAGYFTRDVWHDVVLLMDFNSKTYDLWIDSAQLGMNVPFCGTGVSCTGSNGTAFNNGFFDTFGNGNDFGFLDDYGAAIVNPTPEPASLALLGSGLAAAFARVASRRRSS
jgi:hypothetical protein